MIWALAVLILFMPFVIGIIWVVATWDRPLTAKQRAKADRWLIEKGIIRRHDGRDDASQH